MKERWEEWKEELAVKWFMVDAQQKQAVILMVVALWGGIIDIISARLSKGEKNASS